MDPLALGFIALAAVFHVAWNILLKTAGDPLRTATVGVVAASVALIPLVVAAWLILGRPAVPPGAWLLGIVSGLVEVAYFVFLTAAYRRGDLSVVYPLARGTAPLLAVAAGVLVLGERLPPGAWAGVGLLVAGLLVVQRPWRLLGASRDRRTSAGFALLAGVMIATYSSLDRVGVGLTPAWIYAGILWPVCGAGLLAVAWLRPRVAGGAFTPVRAVALDVPRATCRGGRAPDVHCLCVRAGGAVPGAAGDRGAAARVGRAAGLHVGRSSPARGRRAAGDRDAHRRLRAGAGRCGGAGRRPLMRQSRGIAEGVPCPP